MHYWTSLCHISTTWKVGTKMKKTKLLSNVLSDLKDVQLDSGTGISYYSPKQHCRHIAITPERGWDERIKTIELIENIPNMLLALHKTNERLKKVYSNVNYTNARYSIIESNDKLINQLLTDPEP